MSATRDLITRLVAAIDHLEICGQCGEDSLSSCVRGGRDALSARDDARRWLTTPSPEPTPSAPEQAAAVSDLLAFGEEEKASALKAKDLVSFQQFWAGWCAALGRVNIESEFLSACSLSPAPPEQHWQPIETAPKHQWVLVTGAAYELPVVARLTTYWGSEDTLWVDSEKQPFSYSNELPTHWMPLPAPPPERT